VILFKGLDLTNQYLFVQPGSYTIQFRGTHVKWDSESEIPASNKITLQMRPGTVPLSMQVPARLVEILPKGWDMSLNGRVHEVDADGKMERSHWLLKLEDGLPAVENRRLRKCKPESPAERRPSWISVESCESWGNWRRVRRDGYSASICVVRCGA
jgi:hypothetical protein